ncbi:MAG: GNAT family N-acetyltransferase [Pseudomonadota bacterium]
MIDYHSGHMPERAQVIALYAANGWSSASHPEPLMAALRGSHHLECALEGGRLVGLANAISDGSLVVYYPHLLVHPDHQGAGIGRKLMLRMAKRYRGFHQQVLLAVNDAAAFYERVGFQRTDAVQPMWIYEGDDH